MFGQSIKRCLDRLEPLSHHFRLAHQGLHFSHRVEVGSVALFEHFHSMFLGHFRDFVKCLDMKL